MEKKLSLKIVCPEHEDLVFSAFLGEGARTSVCFECIKSNGIDSTKVETVKKILDTVVLFDENRKKYNENPEKIKVSEAFLLFLRSRDENLSKLSRLIEDEKKKLTEYTDNLIKKLQIQCQETIDSLFLHLSSQLQNVSTNYSYFEEKFIKYLSTDIKEEILTNKEELIYKINSCDDFDKFESIMKDLKENYLEIGILQEKSKPFEPPVSVFESLMKSINRQGKELPNQLEKSIEAYFKNLKPLDLLISQVPNYNNIKFAPLLSLKNFNKKLLIDSKILDEENEGGTLISDWFERKVELELLYQGSRDGFVASTFHSKCDDVGPTLTVAKSDKNCIFGGYTEQSWKPTESQKECSKSWLFSLNKKKKFKIKPKFAKCAIICCKNYLPIFGGGNDISFYDKADKNSFSYSALGHTYDAEEFGDCTNTVLAGDSKFSLQEIEVFRVKDIV